MDGWVHNTGPVPVKHYLAFILTWLAKVRKFCETDTDLTYVCVCVGMWMIQNTSLPQPC